MVLHGGIGVESEADPSGFFLGYGAFGVLYFAAHDAVGLGVLVFVAGVGSPVDGDLVAYAEIEEELRGDKCCDRIERRGRMDGVGDGDPGGGAFDVGHAEVVLELLGVVAGEGDGVADHHVLVDGRGPGGRLREQVVAEHCLRFRSLEMEVIDLLLREAMRQTVGFEP